MTIIIDLIILAILAISIFFAYQKGLTKCIIKILSFFIALIVAAILFKPVSNFVIQNTEIDDKIKEAVVNTVSSDVQENGEVKEDSDLPKPMVEYINDTVKNAVDEAKNNVVEVAAEGIAVTTINVSVAILLFIIVRIALIFVSALASIITELPIIKQFDKAGGLIYGAVRALIIIFVVLAIISLISPLIEKTGLVAAINKSFVASILYNNNILLKIIF